MPHEHINSTPAPRDPDSGRALERVTVGWTRAQELPAGELQTGDVRIISEWLVNDTRFPTREMFDERIEYRRGIVTGRWTTAHTFGADPDPKQSDVDLCEYCGLTKESACHYGSETYTEVDAQSVNVDAGAAADPELRAARERNLGLSTSDPKTGDGDPRTGTWAPDPAGGPYRDAIQTVHREGAPTWSEMCTGFWVTLTRDDANHLVRKLRRAIQEAFGGDA